MVTDNPVTPGKDSNYINYQRFTSGVFPGAYIRVGGWGTNLTTGTHQWYARALIVYTSNIFAEQYPQAAHIPAHFYVVLTDLT